MDRLVRLGPLSLRRLTFRYSIALSLIALLVITAYFILTKEIAAQESGAAIMNIGGRQRMLSQKSALLAHRLVESTDITERKELRSELVDTVRQMELGHNKLAHPDPAASPSGLSTDIRARIYGEPIQLEPKLHAFFAAVEAVTALPDEGLILEHPRANQVVVMAEEVLSALEAMMAELQRESERRIVDLQSLEQVILFTTLLVLLAEALFIFRPAVRKIAHETEQLEKLNEELARQSHIDGLTGIANRRLFDEYLDREWQRAGRSGEPLSLLMADIDFFKAYNDTYGHQAGDECLRRVARTLEQAVKRGTDLVCRYGGEEFAVILPNTDPRGVLIVAEKLRAAVEALEIPHQGGLAQVVTISLGAATLVPPFSNTPAALLKLSDEALYEAKNSGRNRAVAKSIQPEPPAANGRKPSNAPDITA